MLAYLVIREGSKWTDVFRLIPGRTVTIGRAPTNQIVVKDERCSRGHAEVFLSNGQWTVRDLDSRNGTLVDGEPIRRDHPLEPGAVIRIGRTQLAFVHDLSKAFADSGPPPERVDDTDGPGRLSSAGEDSAVAEPTTIMHRRGHSRFLGQTVGEASTPKVGVAATKLCRLAFDLAKAGDARETARAALEGLMDAVASDAGAILLQSKSEKGKGNRQLEVFASMAKPKQKYHRVSDALAAMVLKEGEAVLARNVLGDSTLSIKDSQGEMVAESVICAPIRHDGKPLGLIHLYSTTDEHGPDGEDLEFTLAVADTLAVALVNLTNRQQLADNLDQIRTENVSLREQLGAQSEIVGKSALMQQVARQATQAAPSRATVLIRGESGVGKELVARAVHYSSPRAKAPFVCLNCAALSESLLESELFGHEKGAFTGATERKVGKFEAAHTGTLMLDEIGEMSPSIQAKFLRVLEGHPFERVGGSEPIQVDVRVIAATNRDLEKAVSEGVFRRDLFFRLHVLEILVPALRKRPEDVESLALFFLQKFNQETGRRLAGFTPRAMERMQGYRWPGNVRELKNVIERAVVLARGEFIDVEDLTLSSLDTAGDTVEGVNVQAGYRPMSLEELERRHISATLRSTGWNKSQSAGILGIERSTLDRKIRRYSLRKPAE